MTILHLKAQRNQGSAVFGLGAFLRRAEMFFVEARYHRDPDRAGGQVRYISHRVEGLTDGRRRELYGIGERYRAFRGCETAIRRALREDGRGLRNPAYFRFIMTVDNPTAERFKRFDGHLSERVLRDAVDKTFRGAARGAQGVFAVHQHGGHIAVQGGATSGWPTGTIRDGEKVAPARERERLGEAVAAVWQARRWEQNPERAARQAVFRLASRAMPTPMREVIGLLRGLRGTALRQR